MTDQAVECIWQAFTYVERKSRKWYFLYEEMIIEVRGKYQFEVVLDYPCVSIFQSIAPFRKCKISRTFVLVLECLTCHVPLSSSSLSIILTPTSSAASTINGLLDSGRIPTTLCMICRHSRATPPDTLTSRLIQSPMQARLQNTVSIRVSVTSFSLHVIRFRLRRLCMNLVWSARLSSGSVFVLECAVTG